MLETHIKENELECFLDMMDILDVYYVAGRKKSKIWSIVIDEYLIGKGWYLLLNDEHREKVHIIYKSIGDNYE